GPVCVEGMQCQIPVWCLSPDGRTLAIGETADGLHLFDAARGGRVGRFPNPGCPLSSLAFTAAGVPLACGSRDTLIRVWDVRSGRFLGPRESGHAAPVKGLAFPPGGGALVSADLDGHVGRW